MSHTRKTNIFYIETFIPYSLFENNIDCLHIKNTDTTGNINVIKRFENVGVDTLNPIYFLSFIFWMTLIVL